MAGKINRRAALAAAGLAAAGFATSAFLLRGKRETVLRVGSQKGSTKAQMTAAGVLENLPYQIEWSEFASASTLLEAINAGAIDTGAMGDAPFLFAYLSGATVKAVAGLRPYDGSGDVGIVVAPGSPIRNPGDLRGRKVTTVRGSIGHYMLLRALQTAGLSQADVMPVFLAPSDSKAALAQGAVDAWSTWCPFLAEAELHDRAVLIANGAQLPNFAFQAASETAIATKPKLLQDFVARLYRAADWGAANPDAYGDVLAQQTGLAQDVARATAQRMRIHRVPLDQSVLQALQHKLQTYQAAGLIPAGAPPLDKALDGSFA